MLTKPLTILTLALGLALAPMSGHAKPRSEGDAEVGDTNHPQILAQNGGEVADQALRNYVAKIGNGLVAYSDQPDDNWHFTILDTPVVNAFATQGGYVYVTRGLLALANDEAELAAVLAHEIAHVTADHLGDRGDAGKDALKTGLFGALIGGILAGDEGRLENAVRSGVMAAIGYMGQFSQAQELEADKLGIQILLEAGYDPYGAVDFLDHLAAKQSLEALIKGQEYTPDNVAFFASHPATNERIRAAISEAARDDQTTRDRPRNQAAYLAAVEGIVYGDVAAQGFVRGRVFSHSVLRFTFTVPEGFVIKNTDRTVEATGPNGATFVFSGDQARRGSLTRYLTNTWAPQVVSSRRAVELLDLQTLKIDGMEAATGILPVNASEGLVHIRLTVIRHENQLYRISGVSKDGDDITRAALLRATKTFARLSARQAARLTPYTIETHKVGRRETVADLAADLPFDTYQEERFRTLNGLDADEELQRGDLVKLIVE